MASGSITFATLEERALAKIGRVLERNGLGEGDALDTLASRDRNKIRDLQRYLDELKEIASPASQVEDYNQVHGPGAWEASYVRLGDLNRLPGSGRWGKHLRKMIWDAVPNCPFKRFQEVFSHPDDYVVPRVTVSGKSVFFVDSPNFRKLSLLATLVSADRIPEKLAEDLEIADFSEKRGYLGAPQDRLFAKAERGTLLRLKRTFQNCHPVEELLEEPRHDDHLDYRVLYVKRPPSEETPHFPAGIPGPSAKLIDRVITTGEVYEDVDALPDWPRYLGVDYFHDCGSAHRQRMNILASYDAERAELIDLRFRLDDLRTSFNLGWTADASSRVKDRLVDKARPIVEEGIRILGSPRHREKQEAREFLTKIQDSGGTLSHRNAKGVVWQLGASVTRLTDRTDEIPDRARHIWKDVRVLNDVRQASKDALDEYANKVKTACDLFDERGVPALFSRRRKDDTEADARQLIETLQLDPDTVDRKVHLQPYRAFVDKICEKFEKFQNRVLALDKSRAKDALLELHVVMKFFAVYKAFDAMKTEIASSPRVTLEALHEQAGELRKAFETHQVFPGRKSKGYQEPFEALRRKVILTEQGLARRIDEIARMRSTTKKREARAEVKKKFDVFLRTFSVEEELAKVA